MDKLQKKKKGKNEMRKSKCKDRCAKESDLLTLDHLC